MKKAPTDLELLEAIHEHYYDVFINHDSGSPGRSSKIYVPLDIRKIATELEVDPDIVFGRLYYHLDEKYRYRQNDGSSVHFFSRVIGEDKHCINFPYLSAVVATLRDEDRKYRTATTVAVISLVVSVSSLIVSVLV